MSKNDTRVFQLDNGYWGYHYAIRIDGKSRESKKIKDEFGNPIKTKAFAAKARQKAIVNEKINAAAPQVKHPRKPSATFIMNIVNLAEQEKHLLLSKNKTAYGIIILNLNSESDT